MWGGTASALDRLLWVEYNRDRKRVTDASERRSLPISSVLEEGAFVTLRKVLFSCLFYKQEYDVDRERCRRKGIADKMKSVRLVQIFCPVKEINRTHSKCYVEDLSTQRGRKRCAKMARLSLSVLPSHERKYFIQAHAHHLPCGRKPTIVSHIFSIAQSF